MITVRRAATTPEEMPLPRRETEGSAGYDLRAMKHVIIAPGDRFLMPTGFHWELPANSVGLIRPRSGLALHKGLDVMAGVIDPDYRGEVQVLLINHAYLRPIEITAGHRIAQMLVLPLHAGVLEDQIPMEVVYQEGTERMGAGFGSTGAN